MPHPAAPSRLRRARQHTHRWLTRDTTSGILLLVAAALALAWANSPWRAGYTALSDLTIGPGVLHLSLPLSAWAADGLLAIFFLVVGLELKHELVAGSLRHPSEAAVPVLAAVGGMLLPAALYAGLVLALGEPSVLHGWAIPTATDIAFALAVLGVFGRGLPAALRVFLLTLAVVDDLLAIVVIAVFYTAHIDVLALLSALACVAVFGVIVRLRRPFWWLLVPLGIAAWAFMHSSGVHATIAGVLLGFTVPARAIHGESEPRTHRFGAAVGPLSSGLALPIFAFFAAGVSLLDGGGPIAVLGQPMVLAIVVALVLGKLGGVLGMTMLVTRTTPLRLPEALTLRDLLPVGFLTGIGFTVALLVAELSFPDSEHTAAAKLAILGGSIIAATVAAVMLRWDARRALSASVDDDSAPHHDLSHVGEPVAGSCEDPQKRESAV